MGSRLTAGGLGAWALSRCGWNRVSATLMLALLALMLHAWHSGLGPHSIVLDVAVLLVAVSGMLVDMPTAVVLGGAKALLIAGLEIAENRGLLSPTAGIAQLHAESRALSFGMLTLAGLITAWIVLRQLRGTVMRAHEAERRMSRLLRLGSDFAWRWTIKASSPTSRRRSRCTRCTRWPSSCRWPSRAARPPSRTRSGNCCWPT
jgi:hypothetical protein